MIILINSLGFKPSLPDSVLGDCSLCGSKHVTGACLKLRVNPIAKVNNAYNHQESKDAAIIGEEKHVCWRCILDILAETVFKAELEDCEPTTKPKKILKPRIVEPPFDDDDYLKKMYSKYKSKRMPDAEIATLLKMNKTQLKEKIKQWYDEDEYDKERIRQNEEIFALIDMKTQMKQSK